MHPAKNRHPAYAERKENVASLRAAARLHRHAQVFLRFGQAHAAIVRGRAQVARRGPATLAAGTDPAPAAVSQAGAQLHFGADRQYRGADVVGGGLGVEVQRERRARQRRAAAVLFQDANVGLPYESDISLGE